MIVVRELAHAYRGVPAVSGVSFAVERGELFGLVGPDGAGKTTILRMLSGVVRPRGGDAQVAGASVVRDPERVKQSIAYMSQRFGLYTDLTVEENLAFYADLYRVPRAERAARLERLYRFSGLGPFRTRLAGKLSGGMKQKLGLSCALVHSPEVLLLDEPTFGVDPISRRDLWLIVHEMVAQGVTAIVSTSYLDEAERFDRVALLNRGRILALDTPDRLRAALAGRILGLRCDRPRAAHAIAAKIPGVSFAALFGEVLHLVVDSAERERERIAAAMTAAGCAPREIVPLAPSLEDLFMERIARAEQGAAAAGPGGGGGR